MAQKKLAKLVERAKGSDRSIREYALAAGVNASTISRTINGNYTPGIKVLQKLTSQKAEPRGGVTFQDLISATDPSAIQIVGSALESLGKMTKQFLFPSPEDFLMEMVEKETEKRNDFQKFLQQFSMNSMGILYNQLLQKEIIFRPGKITESNIHFSKNAKLVYIENSNITMWFFSCITFFPKDRDWDALVKRLAITMFQELIYNVPDPQKKYSIVVNDDELFSYLLKFRDKNSYRGNLSIIQVDTKNIRVVREEYIAHYDLDSKDELLMI